MLFGQVLSEMIFHMNRTVRELLCRSVLLELGEGHVVLLVAILDRVEILRYFEGKALPRPIHYLVNSLTPFVLLPIVNHSTNVHVHFVVHLQE